MALPCPTTHHRRTELECRASIAADRSRCSSRRWPSPREFSQQTLSGALLTSGWRDLCLRWALLLCRCGAVPECGEPAFAVASVGRYNSFKHPRLEVMRRFADAHVDTFRTDLAGTVA